MIDVSARRPHIAIANSADSTLRVEVLFETLSGSEKITGNFIFVSLYLSIVTNREYISTNLYLFYVYYRTVSSNPCYIYHTVISN